MESGTFSDWHLEGRIKDKGDPAFSERKVSTDRGVEKDAKVKIINRSENLTPFILYLLSQLSPLLPHLTSTTNTFIKLFIQYLQAKKNLSSSWAYNFAAI